MERTEVVSRERFSHDPLYAHAKKLAEGALRNFERTTDGHLDTTRAEIDRYRSPSMRTNFLDALRSELILGMEEHRKD